VVNIIFILNSLFSLFLLEEEDEDDDDDNPSTPNTTVFIGNGVSSIIDSSTAASGILRSKDLRSVVETKRRNFSRSRSSSDSEDNASNHDTNRSTNRKQHTRSPTRPSSFQESGELINGKMNSSTKYYQSFFFCS
jgi:hypothetical protein